MNLTRKKAVKIPYEMYTLPKSSERGQPFIDWNEVLKESLGVPPRKLIKTIKKRRNKNE